MFRKEMKCERSILPESKQYLGHPSNVATVNKVNNACGTLSK
jgi:hypothetical protein